jgi:hypothetical protein
MFRKGEQTGIFHGEIKAVDTQGSNRLLQCGVFSSDFIYFRLELSEFWNSTLHVFLIALPDTFPLKTARLVKFLIILHYLMYPAVLVIPRWRRQGRYAKFKFIEVKPLNVHQSTHTCVLLAA